MPTIISQPLSRRIRERLTVGYLLVGKRLFVAQDRDDVLGKMCGLLIRRDELTPLVRAHIANCPDVLCTQHLEVRVNDHISLGVEERGREVGGVGDQAEGWNVHVRGQFFAGGEKHFVLATWQLCRVLNFGIQLEVDFQVLELLLDIV
jgi:hypothetical protein